MLKSKHLLVLGAVIMFSISACASHTTQTASREHKVIAAKVVKMKTAKVLVNINRADFKTLRTVSGIGPKRAGAIISYRKEHSEFKSIYELNKLKGKGYSFSKKYIKRIAKKITV